MKRIEKDIKTREEAEALANKWRAEGFRVGVSAESNPTTLESLGTFRVTGNKKG